MRNYIKEGRLVKDSHKPNYKFQFDIMVIGAGTSGSIAAVSAAERGYSVVCADKMKLPGGMASFGCMYGYHYGGSSKVAEQVNSLCDKDGRFAASSNNLVRSSINGTAKSYYTLLEFERLGISFAADSTLYAVYIAGGNIEGVSLLTADGMCDFKVGAVIDSTGVCALLCGCDMISGKSRLSKPYAVLENGILCGKRVNGEPVSGDLVGRSEQILDLICNMSGVDNSDSSELVYIGSLLSESKINRVKTKKTLTAKKALCANDKAAFIGFAPFDGAVDDIDEESDFYYNWHALGLEPYCVSFAVTKKSMTVYEADNLVICGRAMGLDRDMALLCRMRGDMEQSGEAAAILADETLSGNTYERKRFEGAKLYKEVNQNGKCEPVIIPENEEEFCSILVSDEPQAAYFKALCFADEKLKTQLQNMIDKGGIYRVRAAIVQAALGIKSAKPVLEEIIAGGEKISDYATAEKLIKRL